MDSNKVDVMIGGINYTIVADAEPKTTKEIAAYVDKVLSDIMSKNNRLNQNMINILTLMNITAELFESRKACEELKQESIGPKEKYDSMIEEISKLKDENEDLKTSCDNLKDDLVSSLNTISEMNKQKRAIEEKQAETEANLAQRENQVKEFTDNLSKIQTEMFELQKSCQELNKKINGDN